MFYSLCYEISRTKTKEPTINILPQRESSLKANANQKEKRDEKVYKILDTINQKMKEKGLKLNDFLGPYKSSDWTDEKLEESSSKEWVKNLSPPIRQIVISGPNMTIIIITFLFSIHFEKFQFLHVFMKFW